MEEKIKAIFNQLLTRYPELESCKETIIEAYQTIATTYLAGGKLLIAGNGGSASDAEHIVGELMKAFIKKRTIDQEFGAELVAVDKEMGQELADCLQGALPAIALDSHTSLNTAFANDVNPLLQFAQQINGYGKKGDSFLAISTSGKSKNILYAATVAKAKGMKVIGLTGKADSPLSKMADICIQVPRNETFMIQELHLPIYHAICLMLEERFFDI
ncbi:MAG: SIS domain-containing protein [Bacteroidales bacterium]|nr:SIS domain-containing protein [Bacteroidales bacterium]